MESLQMWQKKHSLCQAWVSKCWYKLWYMLYICYIWCTYLLFMLHAWVSKATNLVLPNPPLPGKRGGWLEWTSFQNFKCNRISRAFLRGDEHISLLIWEEQNVNKGHHVTFLPVSYHGGDSYYWRSVYMNTWIGVICLDESIWNEIKEPKCFKVYLKCWI